MPQQTQDFPTLVQNQVAAIQAKSSSLINFSVGSVLLAFVESVASVALWLQGLVLNLFLFARASTATGSDLDSWMADFGLSRLAATAATGSVAFSRFTTTQAAVVPVGSTVQTTDGTQTFTVTEDTSNAAWSAAQNGYVVSAGTASVSVPVQANTAGTCGNVAAGTITVITSAIPGIDTVTNAAAFTNGLDAETDSAFRSRFQSWLASLSKATKGAVGAATTGVQQGITYTLVENKTQAGVTQEGYFYVTVDDGTGSPSSALQSTIYNAIDAVRPVSVSFSVYPPTKITADVSMGITVASGYLKSTYQTKVQTAVTNYINTLPLGASLPYTKLAQVAYDTAPDVITNVSSVLLNGGTSDVTATASEVIKAGTVSIN